MPKPAAKPAAYRPKGATTRRYLRETRQDLPDQDGLYARQLLREDGVDEETRGDNRHPRDCAKKFCGQVGLHYRSGAGAIREINRANITASGAKVGAGVLGFCDDLLALDENGT